MGMRFERMLPVPQEVKEKYPISYQATVTKEKADAQIKDILCGEDKRMLLIIGPWRIMRRRCWSMSIA